MPLFTSTLLINSDYLLFRSLLSFYLRMEQPTYLGNGLDVEGSITLRNKNMIVGRPWCWMNLAWADPDPFILKKGKGAELTTGRLLLLVWVRKHNKCLSNSLMVRRVILESVTLLLVCCHCLHLSVLLIGSALPVFPSNGFRRSFYWIAINK